MDYQNCELCIIMYLPNNILDKVGVKATNPTHPINTDTYMPSHNRSCRSWIITFGINVYYAYFYYVQVLVIRESEWMTDFCKHRLTE